MGCRDASVAPLAGRERSITCWSASKHTTGASDGPAPGKGTQRRPLAGGHPGCRRAPVRRAGVRRHQPDRGRRRGRRLAGERRATSSAARPSCTARCSSAPSPRSARPSAPAAPGRSPAARAPEAILAGAVSDYFDFLAARPNFIRLIEREALSGARPARGREPPVGRPGGAGRDQRRARARRRRVGRRGAAAPQHHRALLVPPDPRPHGGAGGRASSSRRLEDLERRKRHVVDLVLHGLRGLTAHAATTLTETSSHD